MKDLAILVADLQQRKTIETLILHRAESLRIRRIDFDVFVHPEHDPGVYRNGGKFLSVFRAQFNHALAVLDKEWAGSPGTVDAIAQKIQNDLDIGGWKDRSAVVVIDPELESWVWSESPYVYQELKTNIDSIKRYGRGRGYWEDGHQKPNKPKELFQEILRQNRLVKSAALFSKLAQRVSLTRCEDPAFCFLKETLARWFPWQGKTG